MDPHKEMRIREELNDCFGRRIADIGRLKAGMRTSRLFAVKGKCKLSKDFKHAEKTEIKKARKWKT